MLMLIKVKHITRDKGHFMTIKASMYQDYITTLNGYVPYNRPSKHTAKTDKLKKEIN